MDSDDELSGDGIEAASAATKWFDGPPTLTNADLDQIALEEDEKRAMEALGALSEIEFGRLRVELNERFGCGLEWLGREYKRRRREFLAAGGSPRPKFLEPPEPFPFPVEGAKMEVRGALGQIKMHSGFRPRRGST